MSGSPGTTTISRKQRWRMNNFKAVTTRRVGHRASVVLLTLLFFAAGAGAQQALTWDQVKAKFEASNPVLKADHYTVDELQAVEIAASLGPNPSFALAEDATQIAPHRGFWRPTSGTQVSPNI